MATASKTPEHSENQCPFHAERSGEVREVGGLSSCLVALKLQARFVYILFSISFLFIS